MVQNILLGVMAVILVVLVIQNTKLSRKVDKLSSEMKRLRWDVNQVGSSVQTVIDGASLQVDLTKSVGRNVETLHVCVRTLIDALNIRYAPHLRLMDSVDKEA